MKVNVLGTEYTINKEVSNESDEFMNGKAGYIDYTNKAIYISNLAHYSSESKKVITAATIRHELIHAFLHESGLSASSDWADNEEIVDWIALQYPKMSKVFSKLEANN